MDVTLMSALPLAATIISLIGGYFKIRNSIQAQSEKQVDSQIKEKISEFEREASKVQNAQELRINTLELMYKNLDSSTVKREDTAGINARLDMLVEKLDALERLVERLLKN